MFSKWRWDFVSVVSIGFEFLEYMPKLQSILLLGIFDSLKWKHIAYFPVTVEKVFWVSVTSNGPHFVCRYSYPFFTWGQRQGQPPKSCILSNVGHNMAQGVSHWSFATKAWIRSKANPCWVSDGQNGTEASFSKFVCFLSLILFHTYSLPMLHVSIRWTKLS